MTDPELPGAVLRSLFEAGLPARALVLEITESSVMDDRDAAVTVLEELVAAGITISLDDFGTGYSSLAYLQTLPVQEVKIDRSFVRGLGTSDEQASRALISSVVGLGKAFGLRVVAEGVEDQLALLQLERLGCDVAQGYLLGRPDSAARIAELTQQRQETGVDSSRSAVPRQLAGRAASQAS